MAHHRIGRNAGDYWKSQTDYPKPTSTDTDDEDDPPETSTDDDSDLETSTSPYLEVISTPAQTTISYPSKMSGPPYQPTETDRQKPSWVPIARPSNDDDELPNGSSRWGNWESSQTSTTFVKTWTKGYDQNGAHASTTSTRPTLVPSDDPSEPTSSDDSFPLQNDGADNSSNRTPIYAAAGVVPVMVIMIGFLVFFCLRKRRRQRQAAAEHGQIEEMKIHPKPVAMPYIAPITLPSPPSQAALPQYSPSTPSSSHPPTASSSQPVILGPIPSGNNGAYLTGIDTSDLVSMRSGGVSRQGTVVDRDPFADGRSLEEAPPPYRPSSLPPASLASTSRNSSVRMAAPPHMTSRTQLIERSPFDDPEDDEVSDVSGPTLGRDTDAMSDVSELSYQVDPVIGRSPF